MWVGSLAPEIHCYQRRTHQRYCKHVSSREEYKRGATNEIRLKDSAIVAYNTDRHLAMSGSVALSRVPCHVDAGRYPFGPGVLCTCVCTRGRTTNEHKAARYRIVVDSSGIV